MPPLRVPEDGLLLSGPPGDNQSFPTQAFAITLSDDVLEDLIRSAQAGDDIELSLGSSPALHYGSRSHTIPRPTDSAPHDFYLTQPFTESIKRARKVPNTTAIFMKPKILAQTGQYKIPTPRSAANSVGGKQKPNAPAKSGASPRLDSGLEALQNSLAHAESQKNQTLLIDRRPGGAKKGKSKLLASVARASSTPRSMPGSPTVSVSGGSPSLAPVLSASQQAIERGKGQRISIIHELAAQDQTFDYLKSKWSGQVEDFSPTLRKVADFNEGTQKWVMSKTFWKELDVWNYDYDSQELRQKAIDNAVRQYDKMRVSPSQPQWELLLPKEERGKGKCLSILQVNLTRGPGVTAQATPKIKVQKADDGTADSGKDDNDSKGAAMTRSVSSPLPAKKKISEREAQQKRLLKHKPASAAPARRSASPIKGKAQQVSKAANGATRVLSQEFVADSDSDSDSEDQVLASKPRAAAHKVEDTTPAPPATQTAAPAVKAKPKPKAKPKMPAKPAQVSSAKRRRDDDDGNSSSSGMPLSKRMKSKTSNASSTGSTVKQRQADSSQKSRSSTAAPSQKSKNTSPAKSSPLATSPPTNASDLDQPEDSIAARPARPPASRKRPLEREREHEPEEPRVVKKQHRLDVPDHLFHMAHKFKLIFEKYEAEHYELTALENPPRDRVDNLVDMRTRLKTMREVIYQEYHAWRA